MNLSSLEGHTEASKLALGWQSPRARHMALLERWVEGTQYDHLPDWWGDDRVPLFERGPCIVYPFARNAIDSHVDLVMGEGRFPELVLGNGDTDAPWKDDEDPLSDDERTLVNRFVVECLRQARFESTAREALAASMGSRSACLIFGARNGRLFSDLIKARWVEPTLDDDGTVLSAVIQYPYLEPYQGSDGTWRVRAMLFRREVTDQRDITYQPRVLVEGQDPSKLTWTEDQARTVDHGLGFCPMVWYPHNRGCGVEGNIDGKAIHETLLDEIQAHDFTLSLRHRAALYAGEPQWVEIGVELGHNPTAAGRKPDTMAATRHGGAPTAHDGDNPIVGRFVDPGAASMSQGRKKGPGFPWQYESPNSKVELHSLPGTALQAIDEHARDLRMKLAEAAAVVFLDPGDIKYASALSAKALEVLRSRQLARCDQFRSDVEAHMLIPAVRMLLRIVATLKSGLRIPGLSKAMPIIERWAKDTTTNEGESVPPVTAVWPPYFDVAIDEIKPVSDTVRADLEAGIIRRETAVEKLSDFYGIEDVPAYLEALEQERDEALKKQQEQMHAAARMLGEDDENDGDDPKPPNAPPNGKPPAPGGKPDPRGNVGRGGQRGKG